MLYFNCVNSTYIASFIPDDDSGNAGNDSGDIGSANDSLLYHATS